MTDLPNLSESARLIIEKSRRKVVDRDVNPLLDSLPSWVKGFRPAQISAVEQIVDAFDRGVKVVLLDAPTGTGKTLIAETVRRMLDSRALYICSTKTLQDQFARDFDYAKVLKGRSNYPTRNFPNEYPDLSAADCVAEEGKCRWCGVKSVCPYEMDKAAALRGELAVLNTSYFLTECNGPGRFSNGDRGFVIADEADTLESELMNYVSVQIGERRAKQLGISPPSKVTVASSWLEWCESAIPKISQRISRLHGDDLRVVREKKGLVGLLEKVERISADLRNTDHAWVYTGRGDHIAFRPSRVDRTGNEYLWRHGQRFLLMSASIISSAEMVGSLGWEGEYETVRVASGFPKANRPVIIRPVANMARSGGDGEKVKMAEEIRKVVVAHPTDRVLIHTVSYELARLVEDTLKGIGRVVVGYASSMEKDAALKRYLTTPAAVLVAASMDRGIDLPDDACRVQIIAKCPFPNLGDRQVSARLHSRDGQTWFTVQTVRTMVQMTGRAVRHSEDKATTYVLDSQFLSNVWNKGRGLFPNWWVESLVWERVRR